MRVLLAAGPLSLLLATAASGQEAPLSAIDWLSESVASPAALPAPRPAEPPVATAAGAPGITVTALDGAAVGPIGVLAPESTGLPRSVWAASAPGPLTDLLRSPPPETVPALQDLVVELMLTEADPPLGADPRAFALARVDRLLLTGALAEAEALLRAGDLLDPDWFRRWFDVTLLRGTEDDACEALREHPALAPTLEARVFCLARNGDWNAAALTLGTARALGDVTPEDEALLAGFLDPELAPELAPAPAADLPERPSPLVYRIREAVGELMPTASLPLAFAHADLRSTVAWRTQIEAAERLARRGAIPPETLHDLYAARTPAASGGVWDRAAAIQALDAGLAADDPEAIAEALVEAWAAMGAADLRAPFARLYGPALSEAALPGEAGELALRAALLSDVFADAAAALDPATPDQALWRAIALGEPVTHLPGGAATSVLDGLGVAPMPEEAAAMIAEGRLGEAILWAADGFGQGLDGDRDAVTDSLATLRALGLDEVARRAALELLILPEGA